MKNQDFSSDENFASSEHTIFIFPCEDITVVMTTTVSANEICKSYTPYCYNNSNTYERYLFTLFSNKIRMCVRSIFY